VPKYVVVFIGWGLAGLSFVVALAGLSTPGAGKFISLAFLGWSLLFLPPLWNKTIKYGLPVNIVFRVVAFITLPVIFSSIAIANGYKGSEVSTVTMQPTTSPTVVSPSPSKIESPKPSRESAIPQPSTSSIAVSPPKLEPHKPSVESDKPQAATTASSPQSEEPKPSIDVVSPTPKTKSLDRWMTEDGNSLDIKNMSVDMSKIKLLCMKNEGGSVGIVSAIDGFNYLMLYKDNGKTIVRTIKAEVYFGDRPICDTTDGWIK
jgi:hypothetical protein